MIRHYQMKQKLKVIFIGIFTITLSACSGTESEQEIPVTDVPVTVINTVQDALPGITLSEAIKESKDGTTIYELEGRMIDGSKYEMEITEAGGIIKIELEDE